MTSYGSDTPTPRPLHREEYFQDTSNSSPYSSGSNVDIPSASGSRNLRRRGSNSLAQSFDTIRFAGGVNSLDNFARSWTRAAGYFEVTPARQSFRSLSDRDEEEPSDDYPSTEDGALLSEHSILEPVTTYGSISSITRTGLPATRLNEAATRQAADLFIEQQAGLAAPDKDREPLFVKTVEKDDGVVEHVIVGQSTLPQTVFNSVNVLVGIGLLSLPLGLNYSGWIVGMIFLSYAALVTNYTAKLLKKSLDKSPNKALVTYSDIAYIAFGQKSRILVSILFSFELLAACVALVVLFADSLNHLIPSVGLVEWKIIAGLILTPLSFVPLRVLSFTSIIGIFCTFSIITIVFIDGLLKSEAPGSLRDPVNTYLFPQSWLMVPLSFGLLMSPWGGHGVFPNIYRDMRHPQKYYKAVDITYAFTYLLDVGMAVIGVLMFGDGVRDEVTLNILEMPGYPKALSVAMVVFIAVIPLTKTPLNARPIITTFEILLGVDSRIVASPEGIVGMSAQTRGIIKIVIRVVMNVIFVVLAIFVPSFDRIMSLMGSALAFTICVILPLLFYLKIFGNEISRSERVLAWLLIAINSAMALIGTAFTFIPKEKLMAR